MIVILVFRTSGFARAALRAWLIQLSLLFGCFGPALAAAPAPVFVFSHLAGPIELDLPRVLDGTGRAARFQTVSSVAVDPAGNIYTADPTANVIRKITPDGVVTTFAGSPGQRGSTDGTGSAVRFDSPSGVAVDVAGNVYVADVQNCTIRKITPAGVVSTIAGTVGSWGIIDGPRETARVSCTGPIAVDHDGNIYTGGAGRIRRVSPDDGSITTLAGSSSSSEDVDGTGATAGFRAINGLAVDTAGCIYVTSGLRVRKVTQAGEVTTLAGNQTGVADGAGTAAQFFDARGIVADATGALYVSDATAHTIRKVTADGHVTTIAGKALYSGKLDGAAAEALFDTPWAVGIGVHGELIVADRGNTELRAIATDGTVSTIAGDNGSFGDDDGIGSAARFRAPSAITVDSAGNVYVTDLRANVVRKISPAGGVTTLAGFPGAYGSLHVDGQGAAARLIYPNGIVVDDQNVLWLLDCSIKRISADGTVTTVSPQSGTLGAGQALARAADGTTFLASIFPFGVLRLGVDWAPTLVAGSDSQWGHVDGTGTGAAFGTIFGLAVGKDNCVYAAEVTDIRKITADGVVTTLAGEFANSRILDGVGPAARFGVPVAIATDPVSGDFYVSDGPTLRRVTPAGAVTTIAGAVGQIGNTDGPGLAARFAFVGRLAFDRSGNVYIADSACIRKGTRVEPTVTWAQPDPIASGTALSATQLNATANLAGTFTYTPAADTVLAPGSHTLAVSFAPDGAPSGESIATAEVDLTVTAPAGITTSPRAQTTVTGGDATFTVVVSGTPAPTLQWQVSTDGGQHWNDLANGSGYSGAATATLTITGATASMQSYQYRCVATNIAGTAISDPATLTVNVPPSIGTDPVSQTIIANGSASFTVTAAGTPAPNLQWQVSTDGIAWSGLADGGVYSGARTGTLTITGATVEMSGYAYRCLASSVAGPNTSLSARLTVVSLAGSYFGTFADGGGEWALFVNPDGSGTYIAYLSGRKSAVVAHVTVAADGTFTIDGTEIIGQSTSRTIRAMSLGGSSGQRSVATVAGHYTLTGRIDGISVSGQLSGLGAAVTVAGSADTTAGSAPTGYFASDEVGSSGATYAIVAPSGRALVVATSPTVIEAATGTVSATGQLTATTETGGQIVASVASSTQAVAAIVTPAGSSTPITFGYPAAVPVSGTATHTLSVAGFTAGSTFTVSNTIGFLGTPTNLSWQVLLPAGWSFVSSTGSGATTVPAAGETDTLEWAWNAAPANPLIFTYTVAVPATATEPEQLAAVVNLQGATAAQVLVRPDPLIVTASIVFHSADTNHDWKLSLLELARMIELYNTRNGSTRTGSYAVAAGTEDGFAPDASRTASGPATLTRYHTADTNRDGRLSLLELARVIELYNQRTGGTRTGQYHNQSGTEDGFSSGQ